MGGSAGAMGTEANCDLLAGEIHFTFYDLPQEVRGAFRFVFSEKVGYLAQPADPADPAVSWAAKKRKRKSLMFILHFKLF